MRTMGMDTRMVDMITQIIPMQVTSMKMATRTMIILITTIQITIMPPISMLITTIQIIIMLPTTMLITTIPITTIAVTIIPLSEMNIHLSALTAVPFYNFQQQWYQARPSLTQSHRLLRNPSIRSPTLTAMALMVMDTIIMATKICTGYSCMSWLILWARLPWSFPPS